tara:strand:- start:39 stop:368 length:330 start_codon:yes stop_codon:yes gene_type:complete
MSDIFEDLNKILKKDLIPILVNYFKDPNNKKITDNLNDLINDPQATLSNIFEKFSKNKDDSNNQVNYSNIKNVTDIGPVIEDEYDDLLKRLIIIEENMLQMAKALKEKN